MIRRLVHVALPALVAMWALAGCVEDPPTTLGVEGADPAGDTTGSGGAATTSSSSTSAATTTTASTAASTSATTTTASTGTGSPQQGSFDVELVDSNPSSDLMTDLTFDLTITPEDGFSGAVELAATLPSGVTVDFDDPSPSVTSSAAILAHGTLHVDSTVIVGASDFTVSVTAGSITKSANGLLTVNPSITVHLPQGILNHGQTPSAPYKDAYGPYPIVINANGSEITLHFMNDDDSSHEIHSDSSIFQHDPGMFGAHAEDPLVRTLPPGQYDWYLHDEGNAATPGQMIIN